MERRMGWVVLNQYLEFIYLGFEERHEEINHRDMSIPYSYNLATLNSPWPSSVRTPIKICHYCCKVGAYMEGSTCVSTETSFEK